MPTHGYELDDLKEQYKTVSVSENGSNTYVLVEKAGLPPGCHPKETPVLLVLNSGQPRPEIYVKPGIKILNGQDPRSTSIINIQGQSWMQFSYNLEFDRNKHSLVQFIAGSLRRFSKN